MEAIVIIEYVYLNNKLNKEIQKKLPRHEALVYPSVHFHQTN